MTASSPRKPLKVVYFNYLWDLYEGSLGSTLKAQKLMRGLRRLGHSVEEFWLNAKSYSPGNQSKGLAEAKLSRLKRHFGRYFHEASQLLKNFRYAWQERNIIRTLRPDIVISRHGGYVLSTAVLAKIYRFPFVLEIDSPEAYENRKFYSDRYLQIPGLVELVERLNFRLAPRGFVQSKVLFRYVIRRGSFLEKDLAVIPNAADELDLREIRREAAALRQKLGLESEIVVGFVGSFHYWHGVENLMAIMSGVLGEKNGVPVHFLLIGGGGAKEKELKSFVRQNGYEDRVAFTGFVNPEQVHIYLQAMDIALAPYPPMEFFYYSPVKMFDYMAHGKPIVASRLGQLAEILVHERTALLCDPSRPDEFVNAILRLAGDKELRQRLGTNARAEYTASHQWIDRAQALERFCKETVGECSGWK